MEKYITIPELAKLIGISRVALFKKVKKGEIKAIRIGHAYAIPKRYIDEILGKALSEKARHEIDAAVNKTVKEYGVTLKLLGKE